MQQASVVSDHTRATKRGKAPATDAHIIVNSDGDGTDKVVANMEGI